MVSKRKQDSRLIGIPLIRAKLKLNQFKSWCEKHGFEGDLEKAYNDLRKKAGLPPVKKKTENKEG